MAFVAGGQNVTRVWVVGTVHAEQGQTTASRLHAILERLGPEVIFLELPPAALGEFLDGTRSNLESTAVRRYRENREVSLVPVDLPEPEAAFFREARDLVETIERTSPKYRRLIDENTQSVSRFGFSYLNSDRCGRAWTEIYEEMRETVEWLGDRRIAELYDFWIATHERREEAMLRKVGDHSRVQSFEDGVLLIGAAHRRSILAKAQEGTGANTPRIEGDLRQFADILDE